MKTILRAKQHSKWRHKHPRYYKADPYYLLTRREQVTVFGLRTGRNRLNYHLYSRLRMGHTEQCPCGTGSQTTEHLLQSCPIYEPLRKGIWPDHTPVARKLYGSLRDLQCTATFIEETGVSIRQTRRRRASEVKLATVQQVDRPNQSITTFISYLKRNRLAGLVVRRPPRERKIPGSNTACAGIFSGSSHTSDFKIGTPVATQPGAWRSRVSAGTGVSIL